MHARHLFLTIALTATIVGATRAEETVSTNDPFAAETWGATENRDGSVTFALHAPGKKSVSVIGDFNDWSGNAHPMSVNELGTWTITIPLEPGTYIYQYLIDGEKKLADPYARDVTWKDGEGRETWRPDRCFTVLEVGADPFKWTAKSYKRPPLDNLVVYELHLEDFVGRGKGLTTLIDRLDYIQELGATAIHLLPFTEFPGDYSWGYNPAYHFAPESAYGSPTELKELIDAAHTRGLAVIIDLVLNHMDQNSALYQLYGNDYDASPYFHLFEGDNWGFPDLDQPNPAVKKYTADVVAYWLKEYRIDGIRYDATRFTGWSGYNDWGAGWYAYVGRQTDPTSLHIAEHMPYDPALINQTEMDTTWHDYFRWRLRDMIQGSYLEKNEFENILDPVRLGFTNGLQRMSYTESHDEERVMWDLKQRGIAAPERINRCILALAITLTSPGTAMIYSGQEFGEYTRKVVGANPLQWHLLGSAAGRQIYDAAQKLTQLRTSNLALRRGSIHFLHQNQPENMTAFRRAAGDDEVIVCANFGPGANTMDILFRGTWKNLFTGSVFSEDGEFSRPVPLDPGEVAVFVKVPAKTK